MRLCVLRNLYFYNNMMTEIRTAHGRGNLLPTNGQKLAGFEEYDKKYWESMKSLENIRKDLPIGSGLCIMIGVSKERDVLE